MAMNPVAGQQHREHVEAHLAQCEGASGALRAHLAQHTQKLLLDLPPFDWPTTAAAIEASTAKVLEAAAANLDAVAAVPEESLSFETVIRPLMLAPNYKTNHLVCQSKFLQHCSTDAAVREAAESAGKQFAAFKAAAKGRMDVFEKVQAYAATPAAEALGTYEKHFVGALVADFKRGGLSLDAAQRAELQRLLDADAACCSKYGSNLGEDKTRLRFTPEQLEGLPDGFIKERTDAETGEVVLSLKYPDVSPHTLVGHHRSRPLTKLLSVAQDNPGREQLPRRCDPAEGELHARDCLRQQPGAGRRGHRLPQGDRGAAGLQVLVSNYCRRSCSAAHARGCD